MIDISQIVSGTAANATANGSRSAQPASAANEFGDALSRARQAQGGEANAAKQQPTVQSGKATDSAGKTSSDIGKKADRAGPNADVDKTQGSTGKADGKADGTAQRPGEAELAEDEAGTTDTAESAAAAALLAAMLPAPQSAPTAAAAVPDTDSAVGTGMPAAPTAAITGQLPTATAAPDAATSLAEDTLNTIASQRAALAATTAAPDAVAAKAATPMDAQADAGKPAMALDATVKAALSAAPLQGSSDTGGAHGGAAGGRDGAAGQFAAPAQQASAAAGSTTVPPTAALQAALQAASAQAPAEDGNAVATPIDAASPLPHGAAGTSGAPSAAPAAVNLALAPRVGDPQWPQALGQQMIRLTTQGNHTAELQLNPPDLGPLKIVLNVVNDQAQAQFVSPHASVRAAVEAALPQLRHAMADSGIQLGQTSVGAEQFAGQPGQGQQQAPHHRGQGFAQRAPEFEQPGAMQTATAPATPRRVALGEVDTFA